MMPRWKHRPLNLEKDEIRLLQILPVEHDRHVRVKLRYINLQAKPEYVAVSYVWGGEKPNVDIQVVDDHYTGQRVGMLSIRQNLHEYLRMSAKKQAPHEPMYYWIDQISIDQNNIGERNHQVKHMAEIFSSARTVVAWLGPSFGKVESLLEQFSLGEHDTSSASPELQAMIRTDQMYTYDSDPWTTDTSRPDEEATFDTDLRDLLALPYWKRLWVCQEVLLARRVVLHLGEAWCSWGAFVRWIRLGEHYIYDKRLDPPHFDRVTKLCLQRQRTSSPAILNMTWHEALAIARDCECFDPRDKVYGLLSLIKANHRVTPDYDQDISEVLHKITMAEYHDAKLTPDSNPVGFYDILSFMLAWCAALGISGKAEQQQMETFIHDSFPSDFLFRDYS